jgi:hypothetical protein
MANNNMDALVCYDHFVVNPLLYVMATNISFSEANSGLEAGIINGPVSTQFHHHAAPGKSQRSKLAPRY